MRIEEFLKGVPKKHRRFYHAAYAVALSGQGVGGRSRNTFRLGAVIVDGNSIVASGVNSYKTHPMVTKYTEYPYLHAEQAAIFRRGLDNCTGNTIYVVRIRRDGHLGEATPCKICQKVIEDAGIKQVWST